MKIIKVILILVLFSYIPATVSAATVYQDKTNNFQMTIPDNWITGKENTFPGNIFVINYPMVKHASIFMKVSDDIANQDIQETLENYTQQDIVALIESMKAEILHSMPGIVFEDAKARYFAKTRAIQLNYTDGSEEYCVIEFLLQGSIYMLVFTTPTQEYAHLSPAFFSMIESIKTVTLTNQEDIPTV
jgi:hypothetical protein